MEQFDHLEVAQEVAAILKSGSTIANTNRAAAFLRKVATDFSGAPAFAADLRKEKDFYAQELDLPVADIEWMACTLEGNVIKGNAKQYPANKLTDVRAQNKLCACIQLAKQCSRDSWQNKSLAPSETKELQVVRAEAMRDARYWRGQI